MSVSKLNYRNLNVKTFKINMNDKNLLSNEGCLIITRMKKLYAENFVNQNILSYNCNCNLTRNHIEIVKLFMQNYSIISLQEFKF